MSKPEEIVRFSRKPLTQEQIRRIDTLAQVPDELIDFSDAPEAVASDFASAERGRTYRALKKQTTLRLDADILAWFRENTAKGYQTEINRVLRDYVEAQRNKAG
jgi:uncharacterized protein (DUF4415 family)